MGGGARSKAAARSKSSARTGRRRRGRLGETPQERKQRRLRQKAEEEAKIPIRLAGTGDDGGSVQVLAGGEGRMRKKWGEREMIRKRSSEVSSGLGLVAPKKRRRKPKGGGPRSGHGSRGRCVFEMGGNGKGWPGDAVYCRDGMRCGVGMGWDKTCDAAEVAGNLPAQVLL